MKINISDLVGKIKQQVAMASSDTEYAPYIPDIIEFCTSKRYLNLPGNNVELYPLQKIILKVFYRGQRGNEHVKLTPDELELLFNNKMQSVLDKYYSPHTFRELVLVLGRRSGKGFITSIIALYEAMKLLELPGGSPFKYYDIAPGNPIYIITVATSSDQANILFEEMRTKMNQSEYFLSRMSKTGKDKIWLLTPEDRKINKEMKVSGIEGGEIAGSVVIMSGHSNSESLLGKRVMGLLLDEVASFKSTGGASSGDRIYSALLPATADFAIPGAVDEHGNRLLDSKVISISSPRAEEGILHKLYSTAKDNPRRLAIKLPTWIVNAKHTESALRSEYKIMTPTEFAMEFGAEFSGTTGERFTSEQYIIKAQKVGAELSLVQREHGVPGMIYYAQLDPAATSHNYALVLVHSEERIRTKDSEHGKHHREKYKLFVVDHIKVWRPTPGKAINVNEVDEYIINLAKRFRIGMVCYDAWNSLSSIQKLRSRGIPTKMTPYRRQYKMAIYDHLEHLLINGHLALPTIGTDADLLFNELKHLKRIYGPNGYRIKPDDQAPIATDDLCDALAGACGIALQTVYSGYAQSGTVYLPQTRDTDRSWSIGRSVYGQADWQQLNRRIGH